MKQFMANKPIKNGFKLFSLCDATNSYCVNYRFYRGKQEKIKKNLTNNVVLDLVKFYHKRGHIIYTDKYYTSVELFSILKKMGINAVGMVKKTRVGLPKNKIAECKKSLEDNEYKCFYSRNNKLGLYCWKNRGLVTLLSTYHYNTTVI